MHSKLPSSTSKCSLYAKSCMKARIPLYAALGPFPDEPLLSAIDRFLYWMGAKRIYNYIDSENSSKGDYCCSHTSELNEVDYESGECQVKESPTYKVMPNIEHSKCDKDSCKKLKFPESSSCHFANTPVRNISRLENSYGKESEQVRKPLRTLRQSFSLCSLACRKLKDKFKFAATTSDSRTSHSTKWLWTKMESYDDGIQVFEIFKNSSAATHHTEFDIAKAPKIILVILPTGSIMPFETLPRH